MKHRRIGEIATPKDQPLFASKIVKIDKDFNGDHLYILENGCRYIENDLK